MKEEQVILVNENDKIIGYSPKMEAHKKALLHRAFSVFIFNDKGELLMQQRATHKYHSPDLWTNTVCSHQRAHESNLEAGKRRLLEEMGMSTELKEVFHFIYKAQLNNGLTEHELDHVLIGFSNDTPIINPDEVKAYQWKNLSEIKNDIQKNPQNYTEWFKIIFENSLSKLEKELHRFYLKQGFTFQPIFKEKLWGEKKLKNILNKNIPSDKTGESWEVSTVKDNISIIANGFFKGKNFQELIDQYPEEILGKKIVKKFNNNFPLLIKYIDASDDLSIQVHPNDKMAQKYHQSFGKNELWYVVHADSKAVLYIGFKENITQKEYLKHLENKSVEQILNRIPVKKGDVFYIPAGTVHAIGKGVLLAEVQQTSDITYRIYDWNRVGLDGKPRELHTELALKAIDFKAKVLKKETNKIKTPYFQIEKISPSKKTLIDLKNKDCFIILMILSGSYYINEKKYQKGDTVFYPAITDVLKIETKQKGEILMINL